MQERKIVQKVVGAGVILHEGKVLIVHRSADDESFPNLWEVPSGKKEELEPIYDAVKREVKEETGLTIEVVKPIYVFNFQWEREDEVRDATQILFLAKLIGEPNVTLSHEHQDYAWILSSEIDNYNLSEDTKKALQIAFAEK